MLMKRSYVYKKNGLVRNNMYRKKEINVMSVYRKITKQIIITLYFIS